MREFGPQRIVAPPGLNVMAGCAVMPGHIVKPSHIVMAGLEPAINSPAVTPRQTLRLPSPTYGVDAPCGSVRAWMAGSSPVMTAFYHLHRRPVRGGLSVKDPA